MSDPRLALDGSTLPVSACPWCGYVMDAATHADGNARPSAGDLSICLNCGDFLTYGADMKLLKFLHEEFLTLPADTQQTLRKARRIIIERGAIA